MDFRKIQDALDEVQRVLKEPEDKKYKIRVAVNLEISQQEFCAFLLSRALFREFLISEGHTEKMDTMFFGAMLTRGCRDVVHGVSKIMLEDMMAKEDKEKQAEVILDILKKAHEHFQRKVREN